MFLFLHPLLPSSSSSSSSSRSFHFTATKCKREAFNIKMQQARRREACKENNVHVSVCWISRASSVFYNRTYPLSHMHTRTHVHTLMNNPCDISAKNISYCLLFVFQIRAAAFYFFQCLLIIFFFFVNPHDSSW